MSTTEAPSDGPGSSVDPHDQARTFKAQYCAVGTGIEDAWFDPVTNTLMVHINGMRMSDAKFLDALEKVPAPGEYQGLRTRTTFKARPANAS
ncbi:MAG: hypothetical protein K2Z81_16430 [Cyanobacteria bacterium]|nr:hypothetical protein [Cyanobacteriota bacterium]